MMKKVGILTYHYVYNEGAIWQAYSLCRYLREHYPQYHFDIIDYRHKKKFLSIKSQSKRDLTVYDDVIKPLLSEKTIIDNHADELFEYISDDYDLIIVGSDIIWQFHKKRNLFERYKISLEKCGSIRPDTSSIYKFLRDVKNWGLRVFRGVVQPDFHQISFPNAYWLSPSVRSKKCTFAASVGYSDINQIPQSLRKDMTIHLGAFDFISVRDHISKKFVNTLLTDKNVHLAPDPTWLIREQAMEVQDLFEKAGIQPEDQLAGILVPHSHFYGQKLQQWIFPFLKSKGYKIVSVIDANKNADFNLGSMTIHPFQWWGVIKRLNFFVTVRTHPTIASLKYETPFANIDITAMFNRSKHSKSLDMLKYFNLEDCCMYSRSDFTEKKVIGLIDYCVSREWDWQAINKQRELNKDLCSETIVKIINLIDR